MATTLIEQYQYNHEIEIEKHGFDDTLALSGSTRAYSAKLIYDAFRQELASIDDMADQPGCEDSFFVADLGIVYKQYKRWRANLPRIEPMYAVKCNGDAKVVEMFAKLGLGFDCASMKEIQQVMDLGVGVDKIVYANPCKTPSYLNFARHRGVDLMTFDNADELYKCKKYYPNARMLLRIMTDDSTALCRLSVKFGAGMEDSFKLLDLAKELGIDVVGVAFHVGSGAADSNSFVQAIENSRELFDYGNDKLGFDMNILDVGGGFEDETFESTAIVLQDSIDEHFSDPNVQIIAEPGRFFVASAFQLATSVIGRRWVDEPQGEAMIYVNDGVYANLNCIMFDHQHPVPRVLRVDGQYLHGNEMNCQGKYQCSVWGPTCDGLDCITKSCNLPVAVNVGDWLYFDNMGAYTLAASTQFNGFNGNCKVVYVSSDSRVDELLDL